MRVDFYQLGGASAGSVIASLGARLIAEGSRLLVVADDSQLLERLDGELWDQGAASFLAHGRAGAGDDPRQPILLSATAEPVNGARHLLIADGRWREEALGFDRAFFLFDSASVAEARQAWRSLADRESVERHYWAQEGSRWVEKG